MISMAAHALAVTTLVVLPLLVATDKLPVVPTMMAFVVAAPPPPPPPPPPAAPKAAAPPPAAAKPIASAAANAAPLESPAEIAPEPVGRPFDGEGSGEGVEGGLEGGVAGGIVGGLLAVAPPPPPPPPPSAPEAVAPVRVGGAIQAPSLVKRVEPIYPQIAMTAQVTGTVILEAVVSATGEVESVRVLRSIKLLDQAAIDAVEQWRYAPLELNGIRTPFVLTVTLNFSIARRPGTQN